MELLVWIAVIALAGWFWKSLQYDKQTTYDFDVWIHSYETTSSPFKRSGMAVAFLSQSIHFAWAMGAINSKQREIITRHLKSQRATTSLTMLLGTGLPAVIRVVGQNEVSDTPARAIGMLMLLAWMSPDNDPESAVRQHLFCR
ncbi:MAG: hypothetical protein B7X93_09375 [Hydrogenophilales bacterium 17-61-9]|nr:MAG: hypothetical protein B7X93_09375 [Hydrogenophilales bacterium 17-61-9]